MTKKQAEKEAQKRLDQLKQFAISRGYGDTTKATPIKLVEYLAGSSNDETRLTAYACLYEHAYYTGMSQQ